MNFPFKSAAFLYLSVFCPNLIMMNPYSQETNPIADPDEFWYVDKDPNRERTRSSGNLFDDERHGAFFSLSCESYREVGFLE